MLRYRVTIVDRFDRVRQAAQKGAFKNLGNAAASIRNTARAAVQNFPVASPPGFPPFTRRGQLRRAIFFAVNARSAVIGPVASRVGTSAVAHEFGGRYKKQIYPARPFMRPSLEVAVSRFAGVWRDSFGG